MDLVSAGCMLCHVTSRLCRDTLPASRLTARAAARRHHSLPASYRTTHDTRDTRSAMARLNEPPRKPVPASTFDLLSDSAPAASDPATGHPPLSPAAFGANLLNAARVDFRHSSPTRMAPKAGKGRLSRVGLFTEPRRPDLARPRGRDVWEMPESPEKRPFKLHETVNREPLRIVRKKKASQKEPSDTQGRVDSHEQQEPVADTPMPSSPPRATLEAHHADNGSVVIEEHLPNGEVRCAATIYKYDKPKGPRYAQCHTGGTISTENGPRCPRHVQTGGSVRCEYIIDQDGGPIQCIAVGLKGTAKCTRHAALETRAEPPPKRKPENDNHAHGRQSKHTRSQRHATAARNSQEHPGSTAADERPSRGSLNRSTCEVLIPVRNGRSREEMRNASSESPPDNHQQNDVSQSDKSMASTSTETTEKPVRLLKKTNKSKKPSKVSSAPQSSDEDGQESENDAEQSEEREVEQTADTPEALQRVFQFLDLERRPGRCQTESCLALKRACAELHSRLQGQGFSFEDTVQSIRQVREAMKEVRAATPNEDRCAVKLDTYAYIFRSLVRLLKSLYARLAENCEDVTTSLDSMRIISPFIRDILALKDCIAEWKVSIPGRYNGDRLVKDVNSHLIAPLREAEGIFRKGLAVLKEKERNRIWLASLERQNQEEREEAAKREEAETSRRERWARWQALHITRQQCEPDGYIRRKRLWIATFEDLVEKDADGVTFERLQVFEPRSTPLYHSSTSDAKSWSPEQETALLDGLQRCAGKMIHYAHHIPFLTVSIGLGVFHDVFRAYCRPGGLLRDFTVLEIVTRAASLRSELSSLYQEHGWEIPAWVKQIPILP
jgi:hypothetical protein